MLQRLLKVVDAVAQAAKQLGSSQYVWLLTHVQEFLKQRHQGFKPDLDIPLAPVGGLIAHMVEPLHGDQLSFGLFA